MRFIPLKIKKQLLAKPQICARRSEGGCHGRITWEHAWIYANQQINEIWAIIFLCERHHGLNPFEEGLDKDRNRWLSLQQATLDDLKKYPNKNWLQLIDYLSQKFGRLELLCPTSPLKISEFSPSLSFATKSN